jgi:exopolysaccharide biosynthesis predicted pyruvyltransferase EpsI
MFSDLEAFLRSLKGESIVYVPNGGNAGDSFIAHATYQLFSRLGLDCEIGDQSGNYPGKVLIHGGGGNLVRPYTNGIDFIKRNLDHCRKLVILPHTIRAYEDVLNRFGSNCFVFCRERSSFDFVARNAPLANVFLSHDLALAWDKDNTRQQMGRQRFADLANMTLLIRDAKRLVRVVNYRLINPGRTSVLNVFRTDLEKTKIDLPRSNIDLSHAFAADDMSPASSLHTAYWMMQFIDRFQVVNTNRLHIGIMSVLLGKELYFSDNAYGKNSDIFEHSLRGRFANVHWRSDVEPALG